MMGLELTTPWWSALATELNSSKAIAEKELSLSSWCIASLYIFHFSTVVNFSSEKYSGSTGHRMAKLRVWIRSSARHYMIKIIKLNSNHFVVHHRANFSG